jgi:hypothetical protein
MGVEVRGGWRGRRRQSEDWKVDDGAGDMLEEVGVG